MRTRKEVVFVKRLAKSGSRLLIIIPKEVIELHKLKNGMLVEVRLELESDQI